MQKKSSQNSNAPVGGVILKLSDLNSDVSIKGWIKETLNYSDKELSNDSIKSALEGILRDPIFVAIGNDKKNIFIKEINKLIRNLK